MKTLSDLQGAQQREWRTEIYEDGASIKEGSTTIAYVCADVSLDYEDVRLSEQRQADALVTRAATRN